MRIYRLAEYEYQEVYPDSDEEVDYDNIGQAESVFQDAGIRPDSTKNISDIVLTDGTVIGATSSGWYRGEDNDMVFAFDVAVQKEHRLKQIGPELITRAIQKFENERGDYESMGDKTYMRIEAVNLQVGAYLVKLHGFTVEHNLPDRMILRKE